jgi:two-component system NtrC family response regulator
MLLNDFLYRIQSEEFDLVFLDVRMPDGSGLEILPKIQENPNPPEVVIITGYGDPDGAELAIKSGAWDYITKPLSANEIRLLIERALSYRKEKKAAMSPVALKRDGMIGKSPQISAALDVLAQASGSDTNILITGETGTGKELFAWAIHENSRRKNENFVVVDCASLPETLVESVLFGHRKGAYTGADRTQEGLIKQADKGTLFLDEVGELPLSMQKSFLRVLHEHKFRPVGANQEVRSDFRLVAATNRDLQALTKKKKFREDLLFRLRTLVIELPPLRDIKGDLRELVLYYLNKLCSRYGTEIKGISPGFWKVLHSYNWPGNVRELIQALERSIVAAQNDATLFVKHLPQHIRIEVAKSSLESDTTRFRKGEGMAGSGSDLPKIQEVRDRVIADAERKYLDQLIDITGKDIREACAISGLSRSRLYTLLKKYNITVSR